MKKKNILTAAVSLSLVACLSIGATLAYFTDKTETKTNTLTAGKVDIELIDTAIPADPSKGETWQVVEVLNGLKYQDVMPGDNLSKIVGLTTSPTSEDAYVAIRVTVNDVVAPHAGEGDFTTDEITAQISDIIASQVNADEWISRDMGNGDVIYYYHEAVPAKQEKTLFENIPLPGSAWNNQYAELSFDVDVQAAAIQATNTDLEMFMEMDWSALEELAK